MEKLECDIHSFADGIEVAAGNIVHRAQFIRTFFQMPMVVGEDTGVSPSLNDLPHEEVIRLFVVRLTDQFDNGPGRAAFRQREVAVRKREKFQTAVGNLVGIVVLAYGT